MCKIYLFKSKSHDFEIFKDFRELAKMQCGHPVKCLRSNNGGEYVSQQFEYYLL